jgi:copper resistance protein C
MRRAGILIAVIAVVILGVAAPVQAHNFLVSSTPAAGQTLTELPEQFDIVTNEPMLTLDGTAGGFAFQIVDAAGLHYETGCVDVSGATMSMQPRLGAAGTYTATWQVVSADGHSVSDAFTFSWQPSDDTEVSIGLADAPACGDPLAAPSSTPSSSATAAPPVTQPGDGAADADPIALSDVLWIGGALLGVGVAVGITILVLSRRRGR